MSFGIRFTNRRSAPVLWSVIGKALRRPRRASVVYYCRVAAILW